MLRYFVSKSGWLVLINIKSVCLSSDRVGAIVFSQVGKYKDQSWHFIEFEAINPLRPNSDLSQTSHCNIKGLSVSVTHPSISFIVSVIFIVNVY